ncbi:MAG: acyl-CoA thioesterase [Holdemanella sp.]|nr:acyl-CoA thioesterase [Holdemanella sp.]
MRERTVKASTVETVHLIRNEDLNNAQRLHGGRLALWIDDVAALVAVRHSGMKVTTASIDNLRFLRPVYLTDIVVIIGKPTHVGNTSMEIKVETYVEHLNRERELVNKAYFTLVGLDENDKPSPLPKLVLETEEDQVEWENAEIRRALRKEQREMGFNFYE